MPRKDTPDDRIPAHVAPTPLGRLIRDGPAGHDLLARLGRHPWAQLRNGDDVAAPDCIKFSICHDLLPNRENEELIAVKGMIQEHVGPGGNLLADMLMLHATCRGLVSGPKTVRLTPNQCRSLANVSLTLPAEAYRQPFEVVGMDLPDMFIQDVKERVGFEPPKSVVVHRDPDTGIIYLRGMWSGSQLHQIRQRIGSVFRTFSPLDPRPLEALMQSGETMQWEYAPPASIALVDGNRDGIAADLAFRVTLNACLLMVNQGVEVSPENRPGLENVQRQALRAGPKQRPRLEATVAQWPQVLAFSQSVRFTRQHRGPSSGTGTGTPVKPHWRGGHWRRHPGKALLGLPFTSENASFIPPTMVMSERFDGVAADTAVEFGAGGKLKTIDVD